MGSSVGAGAGACVGVRVWGWAWVWVWVWVGVGVGVPGMPYFFKTTYSWSYVLPAPVYTTHRLTCPRWPGRGRG